MSGLAEAASAVFLENAWTGRHRLATEDRSHPLHVRFGVLLNDDLDGRRKFDVAAHVIVMGVGVDDRRDRFVGELLHLVDDRLTPTRNLGVDDGHAGGRDERRGVPATAFENEQVVRQFLYVDNLRRRRGSANAAQG